MTYKTLRATALLSCIFMQNLIITKHQPHLVSQDELIDIIEQSNEQLAYIPDTIMGIVVRHGTTLKDAPIDSLHELQDLIADGIDAAEIEFLKAAANVLLTLLDVQADAQDIKLVTEYKNALESGDAALEIREHTDTSGKKSKKIYCTLVAKSYSQAANSKTNDSTFLKHLDNLDTLPEDNEHNDKTRYSSPTYDNVYVLGTLYADKASIENIQLSNLQLANLTVTDTAVFEGDASFNNGLTANGNIMANDNVTIENNLTVNPNGGTPTFYVDAATSQVFVNGAPISGSGACACSNLTLVPTVGNQSCVSYYEENGITLKGAVCSSPIADDKGVFLSIDGITQNLRVTNAGNTQLSALAALQLTDSGGSNYVGLKAPTTISSPYTVALPTAAPAANQALYASSPTQLTWMTLDSAAPPSATKVVYVSKAGNDTTGNGSIDTPYASLSKAISIANGLSSALNPIIIYINPGIYVENNSTPAGGPLTITAVGLSIFGGSANATIIEPNTPANTLIASSVTTYFNNITFASAAPVGTGISLSGTNNESAFNTVGISGFGTGVSCGGANTNRFNGCSFVSTKFISNHTGLSVNNVPASSTGCVWYGNTTLTPANTGISVTGSEAAVYIAGAGFGVLTTAISSTNNATLTLTGVDFIANTNDLVFSGGSQNTVMGSTFNVTNTNADVKVSCSGAGTNTTISSCIMHGQNIAGVAQGTALQVTNNATLAILDGEIQSYTTAIQAGGPSDTSSTVIQGSALAIYNCMHDIVQQGSSTLQFTAGSLSSTGLSINNPANVQLSFFDLANNASLNIGSFADIDTSLLHASTSQIADPQIVYKTSLYDTKAIGYQNTLPYADVSWFTFGNQNTWTSTLTSNDTSSAGLRLASDTSGDFSGTDLRGWDIVKNGSTNAPLSFNYQNSDMFGLSAIPEYTVMQLDGALNQVQLPNDATQMVFGSDTTLYRSAAETLATNGNLVIDGLTASSAVATDTNSMLVSSTTTSTELGYLHGTTSSVQTQLNGKVNISGSTMTGTLTLASGSTSTPSLQFNGSTDTGLSAATSNNLSISTNGLERMKIDSSGNVTLDTYGSGVIHCNSSGLLSSSSIVDADIQASTITNDKLATASSGNTVGYIVVRDGSGNFATKMITIDGTTTNPTDVATKSYVDSVAVTGLVVKNPALVVSLSNVSISGLQTIDGESLSDGDRVLLVGQSDAVDNGLWVASTGAWTRPTDFEDGTTAGTAYVLITSGYTEIGSSWVCNTPTAIIGYDNLSFELFSLPSTTTAANIGGGAGIWKNTTANTINLKTLVADAYTQITDNADTIGLGTNATSDDVPITIVARDAYGDFSAGTITANLAGSASLNVLKAGDTMTGPLQLPAGGPSAPTLYFSGSTNTGLSTPASNTLSFSTNGNEQMAISSTGVLINSLAPTAGVVHNDTSGNLSSSLIVNADISPTAGIANSALATLNTPGLVANAATTATPSNATGAIVARDSSGNFTANIISASSFNGPATGNLPNSGGTLTGTLTLPVGAYNAPSLTFAGYTGVGLSVTNNAPAGNLVFSANDSSVMEITSGGSVSIQAFTTAGVVHNDSSGNLSSSQIVNSDIKTGTILGTSIASNTIANTNLETLTTAGLVANSATTATSADTANAIVSRDSSGNFSAGTITATLNGSASGNLPISGGTLTGDLTLPAGTDAAPSLNFVGSTNTGLSAATANTLGFDANGIQAMNITGTGTLAGTSITHVATTIMMGLLCNQAVQTSSATSGTITVANGTSILLLTPGTAATVTIDFPPSPINGQLFTILAGTTVNITITNSVVTPISVVNAITELKPGSAPAAATGGTAVTYFYNASTTTWYRIGRG